MGERRVPLSKLRIILKKNLQKSTAEIPQVTGYVRLDCTQMLRFQNEMKEKGMKIPTTVLLVKAIAMALKEYPDLNARLEGDEVVVYDSINAGIGVNTPKGLVVVVLKDLQDKTLPEAAEAFRDLMTRLQNKKLTMDEITGSTFTVSNLSKVSRSGAFTSIVNNNEAFILGLSGIVKEAVVLADGTIAARDCANLITNTNHILVDGMTMTQFRNRVCEYLEDPYAMMENA